MPVTIRDVARASGVHVSTVSRTFSAPHLVNPDTRDRVIASAEQLGYRPNRAARALITGRTHNLGLIVADIANPFFPPLIKAAESQARLRDYHVFIADTNEDPVVEADLVQALAKQVDGILLCSPRMSNDLVEQLRRVVPLVVVNRLVENIPVTPATTVSSRPPTADATTGTPQAIASRAVIPNGSYHGTVTATSADRNNAGMSSWRTWPRNVTRSATPCRSATSRRREISGSSSMSPAGGPPATSNSVPASPLSASSTVWTPFRSTSRPTVTRRCG